MRRFRWLVVPALFGAWANSVSAQNDGGRPAAKPAAPKADLPPDPRLAARMEALLKDWEKQSAETDTLEARFTRLDVSQAWGDRTEFEGWAVLKSPEFKAYATQFKSSPHIKGIRQVLHGESTPASYCLSREFIAGIRLLGELGLSYDLCMRSAELPDATMLVDACPDTRFILDHCGNEDVKRKDHSQWQKDIAELAKRKNIVGKVSGIVASAKPGAWSADDLAPVVNHTLAVFGRDRVMFGGDWPVCTLAATYRKWVEALQSIVKERPSAEQKKLFHDNAVAFYGLK